MLPGYCGADIKAVCSEAALCALRRHYPQIYASSQKLLLDVESISVSGRDFLSAMRKIVPASQRAVASPAKALTPVIEPLLSSALNNAMEMLQRLFPHVEQGLKKKRDAGKDNYFYHSSHSIVLTTHVLFRKCKNQVCILKFLINANKSSQF